MGCGDALNLGGPQNLSRIEDYLLDIEVNAPLFDQGIDSLHILAYHPETDEVLDRATFTEEGQALFPTPKRYRTNGVDVMLIWEQSANNSGGEGIRVLYWRNVPSRTLQFGTGTGTINPGYFDYGAEPSEQVNVELGMTLNDGDRPRLSIGNGTGLSPNFADGVIQYEVPQVNENYVEPNEYLWYWYREGQPSYQYQWLDRTGDPETTYTLQEEDLQEAPLANVLLSSPSGYTASVDRFGYLKNSDSPDGLFRLWGIHSSGIYALPNTLEGLGRYATVAQWSRSTDGYFESYSSRSLESDPSLEIDAPDWGVSLNDLAFETYDIAVEQPAGDFTAAGIAYLWTLPDTDKRVTWYFYSKADEVQAKPIELPEDFAYLTEGVTPQPALAGFWYRPEIGEYDEFTHLIYSPNPGLVEEEYTRYTWYSRTLNNQGGRSQNPTGWEIQW